MHRIEIGLCIFFRRKKTTQVALDGFLWGI